ncbi:hypothetical protein BDZ89DRAFT_1231438 [Hymenopellis radicata]|nr:hypothetical protein BDZ89DRAFT_1231438 [Hymenopellis radicata]
MSSILTTLRASRGARISRTLTPRRSFRLSSSPRPTWKIGEGVSESWKNASQTPRKSWDMKETPTRDAYRLLTSAIIPRPIAFVSTLSEDGVPNLAPFRYCCIWPFFDNELTRFQLLLHGLYKKSELSFRATSSQVSSNPPMLSVSFSLPSKRKKDTRENILATKEFTVNLISESFVEASNITAVETSEVNEWLLSGLTMEPSTDVKPACVQESAICMECELYSYQDIVPSGHTTPTTTLALGLIKRVHARESVLHDDGITVDPKKLQIVSRLGGLAYGKLVEGFEVPRPSWKELREEYQNMLASNSEAKRS